MISCLRKQITKVTLVGCICVSILGCGLSEPKDEVREAFETYEVTDLVKNYNKADKTRQNDYKVNFSQYFKDEIIRTIDADIMGKYSSDGMKRWENLNKVAKFAVEVKDDDYLVEQRLAEEVEKCYKIRKDYTDGCLELYKKYKVNEYEDIFTIRRYLVNELKNSPGLYYACGYKNVFGNVFPVDDVDECVVEIDSGFTNIRRGVNRLNVVRIGREKITMDGGFRTEVDKFRLVGTEAIYIQEDLHETRLILSDIYKYIKNSVENGFADKSSPNQQIAVGKSGVITGDGVNFRIGPSTASQSIGAFYKGDAVNVVSKVTVGNHTWYKVEYHNPQYGFRSGFVSSDYVSVK